MRRKGKVTQKILARDIHAGMRLVVKDNPFRPIINEVRVNQERVLILYRTKAGEFTKKSYGPRHKVTVRA